MERRNFLRTTAAGLAAATMAPTTIQASDVLELKLAMSWIKNSPGTGSTAARLAKRIELLSGGRIKVKLFGAGELVGPFDVLEAVGAGTADLGHSAAFFWQGKMRASAFFTAVPFGLIPQEHMVWIYHGNGQELWDELYSKFNVKPFLASNTSIGMGGWFQKPINSLEDLLGMRYRMPGLGGEVVQRMGAIPITLSPLEILPSLNSKLVDAAEWLGPWSDLAMGFYKSTPYYYGPGFHEPNGAAELQVNLDLWNELPEDLKQVIQIACMAEHVYALTEVDWWNPAALKTLVSEHGTIVRQFPDDFIVAARKASEEVLEDLAKIDDITARITQSYTEVRDSQIEWSKVSQLPFLRARVA